MVPPAKPDSSLVIVWWLWFVPALLVLVLPLRWFLALLARGLEGVLSTGVEGDGFAIFGRSVVPAFLATPPLLLLSALYGFLFWRHRERRIPLAPRFWIPVYGSALLFVMIAAMVLAALSRVGGAPRP